MYTKETKDAISREFGGLPLVDAEYDDKLYIKPTDIESAERGNFGKCVFANAACRQYESNKVLFMKTVCYIAVPDEDGERKVERYLISKRGRQLIEKFDKGEEIEAGGAFRILAPKKDYEKIDYSRKAGIKHRKKKKEETNDKPKKETHKITMKTNMTDEEKADYVKDSAAQEKEIALKFLQDPNLEIGIGSLHEEEEYDWPITSTRRAFTNLKDAGIIRKLDDKKMGSHGRTESVWVLNNISSKIRDELVDTAHESESTVRKMQVAEYEVRNGRGVLQYEMAEAN